MWTGKTTGSPMASRHFYHNGSDPPKDGAPDGGGIGVKDVKLEGGRNLRVFVCD